MPVSRENGDSPTSQGQPAEQPAAISVVDSLCATSVIAHEAIFELRRRIGLAGVGTDTGDQLVTESAKITTQGIPAATAEAHRLIDRWGEQALLDPPAARLTAAGLSAEVAACEPTVRALLGRQRELAEELSAILTASVD